MRETQKGGGGGEGTDYPASEDLFQMKLSEIVIIILLLLIQ